MLALLAALLLQPSAPADPSQCASSDSGAPDLRPRGSRPLHLAAVYCHQAAESDYSSFNPAVSPDGRMLASLSEFARRGRLTLLPLSGRTGTATLETLSLTFMRFAGFGGKPFFQWSDDSRFVWAARHPSQPAPGGWVTTPLQPVRLFPDGRVADLPRLAHPAGSLDGLLWVGGSGLALAKFGTQGGFYRPERPNPAPTIAIVDAARGRVLDAVRIEQILRLAGVPAGRAIYAQIRAAYVALRPDGRVRALLDVQDHWILWDQGRPPRLLPGLQAASRMGTHGFDGSNLLVMRPRAGFANACGGYHGPCPRRQPERGVWAELYDVASGRRLWSLYRDFDVRDSYSTPEISPDGNHALIALEPEESGERVALISMRDGSIVQILNAPSGRFAAGFTRNGSAIWVQSQDRTVSYRFARRR